MKLRLLTVIFTVLASPALADPCQAIPDRGPMPAHLQPGSKFSGSVPYVGDGDSLCIALGPSSRDWVEVRVADFYAPELHASGGAEAKAALVRVTQGKRATCVAGRRSYDRVVADCSIDGRSIGDLMRAQGVREGGEGRKRR